MSSKLTAAAAAKTSTASLEGLADLLECSVCLEPLGLNHKVLPCQHTFCLPCLEDIVKKRKGELLCPECRTLVDIPIDSLPSNVILNRLLSGLQTPTTVSPRVSPKPAVVVKPETKPPPPSTIRSIPPPLAIGEHRKFSLPSSSNSCKGDAGLGQVNSSIKNNNNTIPGNLATNPFVADLLPTSPTSPVPLLPPKPNTSGPQPAPPPLPPPHCHSNSSNVKPHQVFRALYDYKPVKPDELGLKKDELYFVIEKCQDGWFKGSSLTTLKTGVFPGNYVQHVQHEDSTTTSLLRKDTGTKRQPSPDLIDFSDFGVNKTIVPPNATAPSSSPSASTSTSKSAETGSSSKTGSNKLYKVVIPFPASSHYELDLKVGDVVIMNKAREDGWCKGTLQRSGQTGLFPFSFVQKM